MSTYDKKAAQRHKRLIQNRYAERILGYDDQLIHPRAPHGTDNGYRHYGCRCTPCRKAAATYRALKKRQRHTKDTV